MEKKKIALAGPVNISGLTIFLVEQTAVYVWQKGRASSFFGFKKPLYILVSYPEMPTRAFTVAGDEISLDRISLKYPELKSRFEEQYSY
jgi:hypothetical protein